MKGTLFQWRANRLMTTAFGNQRRLLSGGWHFIENGGRFFVSSSGPPERRRRGPGAPDARGSIWRGHGRPRELPRECGGASMRWFSVGSAKPGACLPRQGIPRRHATRETAAPGSDAMHRERACAPGAGRLFDLCGNRQQLQVRPDSGPPWAPHGAARLASGPWPEPCPLRPVSLCVCLWLTFMAAGFPRFPCLRYSAPLMAGRSMVVCQMHMPSLSSAAAIAPVQQATMGTRGLGPGVQDVCPLPSKGGDRQGRRLSG